MKGISAGDDEGEGEYHEAGGQWGEDDDDLFDDEEDGGKKGKKGKEGEESEEKKKGWGEDDDLELSDDEADSPRGKVESSVGGFFTPPLGGTPPTVTWCADSSHAADHLAAGSAESALQLLHRQIALVNAAPLRASAQNVFLGATAFLPGIPLAPSNRSYLVRESTAGTKAGTVKTMPQLSLKVAVLLDQLKSAYKAFTNGQFNECKTALDVILTSIPLVQAASRTETNDLKELLEVGREYVTAIRVKQAITDAGEDVPRSLELSAYFTHCNLQPAHLMLALKTAMASAFKNKNYINAASFARRLLELPDMNRWVEGWGGEVVLRFNVVWCGVR